jgi:hypothetical protein
MRVFIVALSTLVIVGSAKNDKYRVDSSYLGASESLDSAPAVAVDAFDECNFERKWTDLQCHIMKAWGWITDSGDVDAVWAWGHRQLQPATCNGGGNCAAATRSRVPMHKYLRQQDIAMRRREGLTPQKMVQFNGGYFSEPRTSEAPFHSGPTKMSAEHNVKQVNGLRRPVVRCANISPNDSRPCIK